MVTVREILSRFGTLPELRQAFSAAGVVDPPSIQALSSWQVVGRIPHWWHMRLLAAAGVREIKLSAAELVEANDQPREEPPQQVA